MLGVMLQKIWHKKWMVICLLIGCVLLIATVVSFPMYRSAAFDRMLQDEFAQELATTGEWPSVVHFNITSKNDAGGTVIAGMEDRIEQLYGKFGVTKRDTVMFYGTTKLKSHSLMQREDLADVFVRLAMLSGLPEHAEMLAGEMYSEDGIAEDGSLEVVISQEGMIRQGLLLGETIEYNRLFDANGEPIRIKIVGVFGEKERNDCYWQMTTYEIADSFFMNEELFREMFTGDRAEKYTIVCDYYMLFEYNDLKAVNVTPLYEETSLLLDEITSQRQKLVRHVDYLDILKRFEEKQSRIEATLFILQIPVLILLCAFLFMISGQMYDMERNEISVMKSRGSSGGQIFRLYLYQSVFLTLVGTAMGVPLGTVFCRILGSARNFLEFDLQSRLVITYGMDVVGYGAAAAGCCVLVMTLPAIKHSRLSIVNLKQQKALKKRMWWEKCFLDVICLAVGLYGYYNFSVNESIMAEKVLRGESLDPLLYFSSSIFIVGAGLLLLRLQPLLIKLLYWLGKKYWGPASYASFMENMHNGKKQQFIMLFLILTISLGMYHATVARTILQNALDNGSYLDGADVVIKEVWKENPYYQISEDPLEVRYYEPDYFKYGLIESVHGYTKVLYDGSGYVSRTKNGRLSVIVMGIHTKEFGENTYVDRSLLEKHYYEYLNEMAMEKDGILVSRNFQTVQEYEIGDTINYSDSIGRNYKGKIVDFFDYWPGYEPISTRLSAEGEVVTTENYMVVGHYANMAQKWGNIPYEVWISMEETAEGDEIYDWIEEHDVALKKYVNRRETAEDIMEDPLLQGTNGVLTMGFIVTMILCAVGYMIYWIMSIRSREMMFGVLRASGMHKGELFHMLMNEQIFSGVFSVLAGIGIGKLTSVMYVPILQTAYAASNQVLPMQLITNQADMMRLYSVIAGTMLICLVVLIVIVFKLNVAKALKLGEE